jgi:hypothetical protein
MNWLREWRRERVRKRPFPAEWIAILERNVPLYPRLPPEDQRELQGHIQVFLAEKRFEGVAGLGITDEIKVTVAAHACILLLHRKTNYYPGLFSIIVYPHAYIARRAERDALGIMVEGPEVRLGESWPRGTLVLSWDAAQAGATDVHDCHNIMFHEFAHQLDAEDGSMEGAPALPKRSMYRTWARTLGREYERLRLDVARGHATVLDPYGAQSPAEFFAVATECFFTDPRRLRERHPELYEELRRYFNQDPAKLALPLL